MRVESAQSSRLSRSIFGTGALQDGPAGEGPLVGLSVT